MWVIFISSLFLVAKLMFSSLTYGTNDITAWVRFSRIIEKTGTFEIYRLEPRYNHPPLISWILPLIDAISRKTQWGFPYTFRLLPILADYLSAGVIWELLGIYNSKKRFLITMLCVVNPIQFFVSAFHGNTDPVFLFFILSSVYFVERGNIKLGGFLYGLSLCVKIVPLILLPAYILRVAQKDKSRWRVFILCSSTIPILIFLPYLVHDFSAILNNMFYYDSSKGLWGLGHIFRSMLKNDALPGYLRQTGFRLFLYHCVFGKFLYWLFLGLIFFRLRTKETNLAENIFLSFSLFLVLTPGFGVQYLSWLSVFSVIVCCETGALYMLAGGIFLYRVYGYWSSGPFLDYANSLAFGGRWAGFDKELDLVLWVLVLFMLVKFLAKLKPTPKYNYTGGNFCF